MLEPMAHTTHDFLPPGLPPEVAQRQATRYRQMSAEEKLRLADSMGRLAWELTCAGVRQRHPELAETQVQASARAILRAASD